MFDERDLAEIISPEYSGERLIVCRNPILAEQRQRERQELLAATEKELMPIVRATQRTKKPLRGAAEIGVRVGKVINHHKVGKHFTTTITDDSFLFARDLDKIATEEQLDGLYIVRSNVEPELFDADLNHAAVPPNRYGRVNGRRPSAGDDVLRAAGRLRNRAYEILSNIVPQVRWRVYHGDSGPCPQARRTQS